MIKFLHCPLTILSSAVLSINLLLHREKIFGNAENQTQGSWVRSPNDTTVLDPPWNNLPWHRVWGLVFTSLSFCYSYEWTGLESVSTHSPLNPWFWCLLFDINFPSSLMSVKNIMYSWGIEANYFWKTPSVPLPDEVPWKWSRNLAPPKFGQLLSSEPLL